MTPERVIAGQRTAQEHTFKAHDGVQLFYCYWPAQGPRRQGAILLLHRGHEHSGRVAHFVDELNLPHYDFFALDARAHGRSQGDQGPSTSMATFVQDLDEFVRAIRARFFLDEQDIAVVAQSIAAVIAAAWVHDFAPRLRCLVLASPAFRVKLYTPFARLGLTLAHALAGNFFVHSYVQGSALTRDPQRAASYSTDPLIKRPISVRVLLSLDKMAERIVDDAGAIRVPVQLLISGRDWVVREQPQRSFFKRLGNPHDAEWHRFEGFLHDTLGERDRHLPVAKAREYIEKHFARQPHPARDPLTNDPFTQAEYERLRQPLPWWSPKALSYLGQRLFLRTLRRMSGGIRLGLATGFDSGASLDYVYRNQLTGVPIFGWLIDFFYLNAVGWRGIRQRRQLLQELIGRAMQALAAAGQPARILDVAAGHGRYVLECLRNADFESALLRDFAADVWIGRAPLSRPSQFASVLDLTAEMYVPGATHNIPILDLTVPREDQLAQAAAAIEASKRPVLVCCALGYSRSATVAAAWLLAAKHACSAEEALALVRHARPQVVIGKEVARRVARAAATAAAAGV